MKIYVLYWVEQDYDFVSHEVIATSSSRSELLTKRAKLCEPLRNLEHDRNEWRIEFTVLVRDFFSRHYDKMCDMSRAEWEVDKQCTGYEGSHERFIYRNKQKNIDYIATNGSEFTFKDFVRRHCLLEDDVKLPDFPKFPSVPVGTNLYRINDLHIEECELIV